MTTEQDFQNALDRSPWDAQTRLVFADWLDEHDDPRGPGYRALGVGRRRPERLITGWAPTNAFGWRSWDEQGSIGLPRDWWELLPRGAQMLGGQRDASNTLSRREVEDAAATAFAQLPAARWAELLAQPQPGGQ